MAKVLPVQELEFLKLTSPNYRELISRLGKLGHSIPDITQYAEHVCASWFRLGEVHMAEARAMPRVKCARAIYSRAYYAAYNASKALRYFANGVVSLKGDDHGKAVDLPDDFPDKAQWASRLTKLYQCRLYADYDNWSDTTVLYPYKPKNAIDEAEEFIDAVRLYLVGKFQISI